MNENIKIAINADKNAIDRHINNLCDEKMKNIWNEEINRINILLKHIVELQNK